MEGLEERLSHLCMEHNFTNCKSQDQMEFCIWDTFMKHLRTFHNFKPGGGMASISLKSAFKVGEHLT
ncbi:hypothetical protein COL922a_010405 [Colletotrichum nupharicola]|nr:hypothetical protein COL922a_010405 [Colletotrichum nupharicola]